MNFNIGDVVRYIGKSNFWKQNQTHIINECSYQGGGDFEYSTNYGAWFSSTDFKLIRKADKNSFAILDKDLENENFEEID